MLGRVVQRQGQRFWRVNVLQEGIFAELHSGEAWGTSALETEPSQIKTHAQLRKHQPQSPSTPLAPDNPTGRTILKSHLLTIRSCKQVLIKPSFFFHLQKTATEKPFTQLCKLKIYTNNEIVLTLKSSSLPQYFVLLSI